MKMSKAIHVKQCGGHVGLSICRTSNKDTVEYIRKEEYRRVYSLGYYAGQKKSEEALNALMEYYEEKLRNKK